MAKTASADKITSLETMEAKLVEIRAAEAEFSTFSQEQVDKICEAAAMAGDKMRIPLAKMAHDETGAGIVVDKITKNTYACEHIWNHMRNVKTCDVIEENLKAGTKRIAKPIGVIGGIVPTTNPTSTCMFKILICLKTRNAIIISPHPKAKNCTIYAAKIMKEAAEAAGLPKNIINWIEEPSIDLSAMLMKEVDLILATGGEGMVRAAYASGTPAIGVGPGNCNVIIDDSCDIRMAVASIIHSKTFDNGMICATEQHVTVLESIYDKVKEEFANSRCYFLNKDEADKIAKVFFNPKTHGVNANAFGRSVLQLAEMGGVTVPSNTKVLIAETDDTSHDNAWANEKLCPVLGMYKAKDFAEAMDICDKLVFEGGAGHTAAMYCDPTDMEKIDAFSLRMKAARILINTPTCFGGIGDLYNFDIAPSLTLGPGSWGKSSFAGQTNYGQLLNIKTVAIRKENMLWLQLPKKVYFKQGCTAVALKEFYEVYGFKRAFFITDFNLYKLGICDTMIKQLNDNGIATAEFFDIRVDPQIQDAMKGLPKMNEFEPDVIVAVGGGSAIDTGKIMWIMYELPEEKFLDMAHVFIDIRKRVRFLPQLGKKAKLVCIPTTAGTGSECTPFTIISDANTGMKWPIIGYEMMPEMAVVDADNMLNLPPKATQASGFDVLTHAVEAYVSLLATDYTNGFAKTACKLVYDYLPRAYHNGAKDPVAREKMADASAIAGIAFANAFLGINHSLSHKLGGWFHVPHGTANALMYLTVCKYNANMTPTKMGTFSQYKYPCGMERYAELAEYCGLGGATVEESYQNWLDAGAKLKAEIDIPETIQDWGVDEKEFLAVVDNMAEWAFHDACTGCNPVYPTFEDLKECYLRAYYGDKTFEKLYGDQKITIDVPLERHADTPVICLDPELQGGFL